MPTNPRPAGYIEVARQEGMVLLRIHGLGNMNISLTLQDFARASLEAGYTHFAIDLDPCEGMDSTFMGTLVSMEGLVREQGGWLCLINVSAENRRLLKMIGVWGLIPVRERFPLVAFETEHLEPDENPERRIDHIRAAHEHLVAVDERNRERFGRFLETLEKEIEENRSAAEAPPAKPPRNKDSVRRRVRDSQRWQRLRSFAKEDRPPPGEAANGDAP
jgi:anti-sigma B factor antagonist